MLQGAAVGVRLELCYTTHSWVEVHNTAVAQ